MKTLNITFWVLIALLCATPAAAKQYQLSVGFEMVPSSCLVSGIWTLAALDDPESADLDGYEAADQRWFYVLTNARHDCTGTPFTNCQMTIRVLDANGNLLPNGEEEFDIEISGTASVFTVEIDDVSQANDHVRDFATNPMADRIEHWIDLRAERLITPVPAKVRVDWWPDTTFPLSAEATTDC